MAKKILIVSSLNEEDSIIEVNAGVNQNVCHKMLKHFMGEPFNPNLRQLWRHGDETMETRPLLRQDRPDIEDTW